MLVAAAEVCYGQVHGPHSIAVTGAPGSAETKDVSQKRHPVCREASGVITERIAARLSEFRDTNYKIRGLSDLAARACLAGEGNIALSLLERVVKSLAPEGLEDNAHSAPAPEGIATALALCGTLLPAEIEEPLRSLTSGETSISARGTLRAALSTASSDPARAADLLMQLAEQPLSKKDAAFLRTILFRLRAASPDEADALFFRFLQRSAAAGALTPHALSELAAYLLTSPRNRMSKDGIGRVPAGGETISNLTVTRVGFDDQYLARFLRIATPVLTGSGRLAHRNAEVEFGLVTQLAPHAQRVCPECWGPLAAAEEALRATVSPAAVLSLKRVLAHRADVEGFLERAEDAQSVEERERFLVLAARALVRARRFAQARKVAGRLDDAGIRRQFLGLIDFFELADEIRQGDAIEELLPRVAGLPRGAKRALLELSLLAKVVAADNVDELAGDSLLRAFDEDIGAAAEENRPGVGGALGAAVARRDAERGLETLGDAVAEANRQVEGDRTRTPALGAAPGNAQAPHPAGRRYGGLNPLRVLPADPKTLITISGRYARETVPAGFLTQVFTLEVPQVKTFLIAEAVGAFQGRRASAVVNILGALEDEEQLSAALVNVGGQALRHCRSDPRYRQ